MSKFPSEMEELIERQAEQRAREIIDAMISECEDVKFYEQWRLRLGPERAAMLAAEIYGHAIAAGDARPLYHGKIVGLLAGAEFATLELGPYSNNAKQQPWLTLHSPHA